MNQQDRNLIDALKAFDKACTGKTTQEGFALLTTVLAYFAIQNGILPEDRELFIQVVGKWMREAFSELEGPLVQIMRDHFKRH